MLTACLEAFNIMAQDYLLLTLKLTQADVVKLCKGCAALADSLGRRFA